MKIAFVKIAFVNIHLQAWAHWLAALHSESLQDSSYTWVCSDLTSRIVVAVVATLRDGHR